MATTQEITNRAVGGRHLELPGGMAGVFKQQPANDGIPAKEFRHGSCGATVVLQAHTSADAVVMARGECGLSGVVCPDCLALAELMTEPEDEPGLHVRG